MKSPLDVYYEDNHHLLVLKQPGILSQGDWTDRPDVLNLMRDYLVVRDHKPGQAWLGLVHRLDYPVGGLMLLAKTSKAASRLSEQIRNRTFERSYLCLLDGEFEAEGDEGTLVDWLLKDRQKNRTRVVEPGTEHAREAKLYYRVLGRKEGRSLVYVRLETGRSHQIRVQFSSRGYTLVGDRRYCPGPGTRGTRSRMVAESSDGALGLFACEIAWEHITTKDRMHFRALPQRSLWKPWGSELMAWLGEAQEKIRDNDTR